MRVRSDLELGPIGNTGRDRHLELHLACCHTFLHQRHISVYKILHGLSAYSKRICFSCSAILCALSYCGRTFLGCPNMLLAVSPACG